MSSDNVGRNVINKRIKRMQVSSSIAVAIAIGIGIAIGIESGIEDTGRVARTIMEPN